MTVIAIICQDLDLGITRFIKSLSRHNIEVRYVLVAPPCEIHPKRQEQMRIKHDFFQGVDKVKKIAPKRLIVNILNTLQIKKKLVDVFFNFLGLVHGFKVINLDERWNTTDKDAFKLISVVYSLEGLLTKEAISRFKNGIINIHPAIIPEYRGLDAGLWALLENGPVGVSAYQVDEGIDTGPVIKTYLLEVKEIKDIKTYLSNLKLLKYKSYANAIQEYGKRNFENPHPEISFSQNRGVMSLDKLNLLATKLGNKGESRI